MRALNRRVLTLETATAGRFGGVLTYDFVTETPEDALRRAPGPGGYLVVPEAFSPEVWCPLAEAQQRRRGASARADQDLERVASQAA